MGFDSDLFDSRSRIILRLEEYCVSLSIASNRNSNAALPCADTRMVRSILEKLNTIASRANKRLSPRTKRWLRHYLPEELHRKLREKVTKATAQPTKRINRPLVSVVVPIYNVEKYLHECLSTITSQTHRNLQIILINDGSTDSSLAIAKRFAKTDKRISVVTQKNSGLGAARNAGAALAKGKYLVFSDSDDIIPPKAYESMVDSLESSKSDFVTGVIYRFNSTRKDTPLWCRELHSKNRYGIGISDYLDGLVNVYAVNKLYSMKFWRANDMYYPEGVRYEDQEPSTKLFLTASKFDVISNEVYGYRVRDDQSSITQTKHLIKDVIDRELVIKAAQKVVLSYGTVETQSAWLRKIIQYDVIPYINAGYEGNDEYRARVKSVCLLIQEMSHALDWKESPVKVRYAIALVLSDAWDQVKDALLFNNETGAHLPTRLFNGQIHYTTPFDNLLKPDTVFFGSLLNSEESKAVAVVRDISYDDAGYFGLSGSVILKNLGTAEQQKDTEISIWAVSKRTGIRSKVEVVGRKESSATNWSQSKWNGYDGSGINFSIAAQRLITALNGTPHNSGVDDWIFEVEVNYGQISRRTYIDRLAGGGTATCLLDSRVLGNRSLKWGQDSQGRLTLSIEKIQVKAEFAESTSDVLALELSGPSSRRISSALIRRRNKSVKGKLRKNPTSSSTVILSFPTSELSDNVHESWNVELFDSRGRKIPLVTASSPNRPSICAENGIQLHGAGRQKTQITSNGPQLILQKYQINGNVLSLSGHSLDASLDTSRAHYLSLYSEDTESSSGKLIWDTNNFSVQIQLLSATKSPVVLPNRGYSLRHTDDKANKRTVLVQEELSNKLPVEFLSTNRRVRLSVTKFGNTWIQLSAPLKDDESGPRNQRLLQEQFKQTSAPIDERITIFHSYLGEQANDSSLAMAKQLRKTMPNSKIYWGVENPSVPLPDGIIPVILKSREWYSVLSTAGVIVNNIYFDPWFKTRPGQLYVQTWHGTPLKKIGASHWRSINRSNGWISRMESQAQDWTHLISPSKYFSEILVDETGFTGEIVELGYPRNDDLAVKSKSESNRNQIREHLGLAPSDNVVLYAPTWRESLSSQAWVAEMVDFIDMKNFSNSLGQEYKTLVRGHGHNARSKKRINQIPNVIDVTDHPNINDLYIAADVIVTDYSSVMFDAAVANKPIVFFVPDLDVYTSGGRGLYLDLQEIAPGPVVFTQHELVESLLSPDISDQTKTEEYKKFVSKFAPHDDGQAASRVIEHIYGMPKPSAHH